MPTSKAWTNSRVEQIESKSRCCSPIVRSALGRAVGRGVKFGLASRARVPYQPNCPYLDTIPDQADFPDDYPAMHRFRIGSYAVLNIQKNPHALQLIKEYIANCQAVAFSGCCADTAALRWKTAGLCCMTA
jgi:hypothetical protein